MGQPLNPLLVQEARRNEMEYLESMEVWIRKHRPDASQDIGKAPISVRWVDVNKGDDESPNERSSLVAKEIRRFWKRTNIRSYAAVRKPDVFSKLCRDEPPRKARARQGSDQ